MPDTIICPKCSYEIEVTEVLSAQLRSQLQKEFKADIRKMEVTIAEREKAVTVAQGQVDQAKREIDQRVADQLEKERKTLSEDALRKAREQVTVELRDKDQQLTDAQAKLKAAQDAELALRKERRDLEEEKRALELTVTRQLDEGRAKIREEAKTEAAQERALKEAEKDKLIADLKYQIGDLQRKSEQGSQQLQGEVMELQLEGLLRRQFPYDTVEPVPKGIHGGDVVHHVHDIGGNRCGTILWETKRTKAWSDGWLPKLRDDQRAAKAQIAMLVTAELPKGVTNFAHIEAVWVTNWSCAISVAHALRAGLLEVAKAQLATEGRQGKMELLYNYLSGTEFRHRVEGIVEAFVTLREDLETEKRATQKLWAKREKQLERATAQTAGMYGDLSGIIGGCLPTIPNLELPLRDKTTSLAAIQGHTDDTE